MKRDGEKAYEGFPPWETRGIRTNETQITNTPPQNQMFEHRFDHFIPAPHLNLFNMLYIYKTFYNKKKHRKHFRHGTSELNE